MEQVIVQPFYDPARSYIDNFNDGPFGLFVDSVYHPPGGDPQHFFLGHKVYEPFGIPAGPLLNSRFVNAALDMGFDIPVYKTVRTRKYSSHPWPNVLSVRVPQTDLTFEMAEQGLVANHRYAEPIA